MSLSEELKTHERLWREREQITRRTLKKAGKNTPKESSLAGRHTNPCPITLPKKRKKP